jgi:Contractile injection system tube protein
MSLINLFKLEKMRIEAYKKVGRGIADKASPGKLELMFNPATYDEEHAVAYEAETRRGINSSAKPAKYTYTPPVRLKLVFVLDGTGVDYYFKLQHLVAGDSVAKQIDTFKKLCWRMNGDTHEPHFLVLRWGKLAVNCRLEKLSITYKLFDKAGDPLRAELAAEFIRDDSAATIARAEGKSSPDLTHVRIVKSGDTLPLLCKEIYGSSMHYLQVARDNGLDDFRGLTPGQRLSFPPLREAAGDAAGLE